MKRLPGIRDLSDDHHQGLVLARKAKNAAAGGDAMRIDETWREVARRFHDELEPHFKLEEMYIAPALQSHGQFQLVKQLLDDHAAFHRLLAANTERDANTLKALGELLEKHIRFEERELFETAQKIMSQDALNALSRACLARSRD